ncbi:MAG: nucleotidyltransferase [Herbinix sp.]|jgi:NDP-sugar pyrophosphorylase family protein|nr:nucleotidyltransferase [Herbinix sp.]
MKDPVLVIMAAGMGSRYGGLKQIDPVDEEGHLIIDFSIYDAKKAGFKKIIFIIKQEMEEEFKEVIGNRIRKEVEVAYVYQQLNNIPEGFQVQEGRVKPWGTGHAILSCLGVLKEPFAVINADDFYGADAFAEVYKFLVSTQEEESYRYALVGYRLENTLTEHGYVARGVCEITEEDYLKEIHERTRIEKYEEGAKYTEDDGDTWTFIPRGSTVSMNMWGFHPSILGELERRFKSFLEEEVPRNPLKAEYFLPTVIGELLKEDKAAVKVLRSADQWYGVTYKEDKEVVVKAITGLKAQGIYPEEF